MPQMFPLNWLMLYMYFMIIFFIMIINNYFYYPSNLMNKNFIKKIIKMNKLTWKW